MPLSSSLAGTVYVLAFHAVGVRERCSDRVLPSACARPDERIWAQIALDVGRDNFSRDAIAWHEPLVCARHGWKEMWREVTK
jgi:hypothetical protein